MQRVLFNASKAYVRQLDRAERYKRFWDSVRVERTLPHAKHEEGREEGRGEKQLEIAVALKKRGGLSDTETATITGLPHERVAEL